MHRMFFKPSQDNVNSRQEPSSSPELKREPESGWNLEITRYFNAVITYHFNGKNIFFKSILIITKGDNKFQLNFKNPKNPLAFEKFLEPFGFEYDLIQKEIQQYHVTGISLNVLTEALGVLHKQKYISPSFLQDIQESISPNNRDLIKLNQEKEIDEKKPSFISENHQFSLDRELHAFIINDHNIIYRQSDVDFTTYAIPTIERLLKADANPNSISQYRTPLMGLIINQACHQHTQRIASLLLQYGATLNFAIWNKTALHYAALNNNKLWIKHLLELGADATLRDDSGHTSRETYLNTCESNSLTVDPEIENMFDIAESQKSMSGINFLNELKQENTHLELKEQNNQCVEKDNDEEPVGPDFLTESSNIKNAKLPSIHDQINETINLLFQVKCSFQYSTRLSISMPLGISHNSL